MGSSIIYLLGQHRPPAARLAAAVGLGIGAGLLTALITNVIVGAFTSHFLAVWGIATLFALAISLPISAFQALLGAASMAGSRPWPGFSASRSTRGGCCGWLRLRGGSLSGGW
jgi:hypothetical protein